VTKIHTLGDQGSSSINEPAQTAREEEEQKQTVKPPQSAATSNLQKQPAKHNTTISSPKHTHNHNHYPFSTIKTNGTTQLKPTQHNTIIQHSRDQRHNNTSRLKLTTQNRNTRRKNKSISPFLQTLDLGPWVVFF